MRNILLIICLFVSGISNGQTTSFCLSPICSQTIQLPGVDTILASLTCSDGYKGITWTQLSGPNAAIMGTPIQNTNGTLREVSIIPLSGLIAGTYIFKATGVSISGTTGTATTTLTVLPIAIPVKNIVSNISLADGHHFLIYSDGSYLLQ